MLHAIDIGLAFLGITLVAIGILIFLFKEIKKQKQHSEGCQKCFDKDDDREV